LAISDVYAIESFLSGVSSLLLQGSTIEAKTLEMKIFVHVHELFVLLVIIYVVWTVPFFARVTIAITIQKYLMHIMMKPALTDLLDQIIPLTRVFGDWIRFAIITASVLLVICFPEKIQACILMVCLGYNKLFLASPESFTDLVESVSGPNNLDGKSTFLLVVVVISVVWQLLHGFQSSILRLIVPLGFLIAKEPKSDETKRV
jgi:hypothetical protein